MIAALLLKYGIPTWAAQLLKYGIPTWAAQLGAIVLGATLVLGSAAAYRSHVYHLGEAASDTRWKAREKENSKRAKDELAKLNEKVAAARADLAIAVADQVRIETELSHEKRDSAALQAELLAGRQRMSVLTRQRPADPAGARQGAGTSVVGDGPAIVADLDPRAAASLEWLRSTREEAIDRLDACVFQYRAVEKAVNSLP